MARTYTLRRRAEKKAETRRRIVEAAVDLHSRIGPAATSVSMLAEHAGVERHTFYAHFPDERSLFMACSQLSLERDPLPDAAAWRDIHDRTRRLRAGLRAIYGWYERNAQLAACILRDAEHHPLTKEIVGLRLGPYMEAYRDVLGKGFGARQRPLLHLALSFFTWRTLARDEGLDCEAAVEMMVRAIEAKT
ncbi:MAG: helix-turn-helix domain-containing protein [Bdellovibrionota bacterium]|nr:MAG: helix-turn-helix domain-containing protein [Bdellovibrionota bacterium]